MSPRREKEVQVSPNHAAGGLGNKTLSDLMGWTVSDSKGPSAAIGPRSPGRLDFELAQGTNKRHVCQRCRPKQGAVLTQRQPGSLGSKKIKFFPHTSRIPILLQRPRRVIILPPSRDYCCRLRSWLRARPWHVKVPDISYALDVFCSSNLGLRANVSPVQPSLDVSNSLLMHKTF
uniref:Uncharacterized protein n=1 Tax=Coccidioides posadasii RMSCC 3488 TaxID=454284 RepID=A0A0J6FDZ4_COCPO|nr:hypothetical protein CPAG_03844 [Coccidioides posadasii RMSCC 3488]